MTDDEYVAELRTMLLGLNPIGSGSGARVRRMSVRAGGPYPELEIEFDAVVEGADRGSGSVRVDIEREWRELSGYAEPGSYLQEVVERLTRACREVVDPPMPHVMDPDKAWADLLRNLGYSNTVRELGDGRLEVTAHSGEVFTMLVTREQWAQIWAHESDDFFHDLLGPRATDETFIVFHRGELVRSVREQLPPVASAVTRLRAEEMRRLYEEAIARDPDANVGWFAYPPGDDRSTRT